MSATQVKELRDLTGAGVMDCKRALEESGGDIDAAMDILRRQGLAKAEKKMGRKAAEGLIEAYIHAGGRIGSMIELNCETDFVARTDDFKALAHDLALQAAAVPPTYVSESEISSEEREAGIREYGDERRFLESAVFLAQPFIKDQSRTVEEVIREAIGKLGENIVVRRISRFEVGEYSEEEASESE